MRTDFDSERPQMLHLWTAVPCCMCRRFTTEQGGTRRERMWYLPLVDMQHEV